MLGSAMMTVSLVLRMVVGGDVLPDPSEHRSIHDVFVGSPAARVEAVIVIVEIRGRDRDAAIDRVVADLSRFRPVVLRRFDIPLGFSLSIEREGLASLRRHPAVSRTQIDVPAPPTGGGGSVPQ